MAGSQDFMEGVTRIRGEARAPLRAVAEHDRGAKAPPRSLYSRPSCLKDVLRRLLLALPRSAGRSPDSPPRPPTPGLFFPESGGSPNADSIKTLYIMVFVLALFIFAGVEGTLLYSLFKYRARKGRTAAQIHGNTKLEVGWTVGAAVILIFITVLHVHQAAARSRTRSRRWSTRTASRSR